LNLSLGAGSAGLYPGIYEELMPGHLNTSRNSTVIG
jgi:hypothetical protein